jgi:GntR family transcriptional repressor for pyruvate dehydrogenase complex
VAERGRHGAGGANPPVDISAMNKVVVKRLSDEVAENIRTFIIEGHLREGTRLPSERVLAEQFGASRPTVSQALRTLSLMGLVEIRRGSGAYVLRQPDITMRASVDLMLELEAGSVSALADFRFWLETLGVRESAAGAGATLPARAALERLRTSMGETSAWIAADTIFHSTIVSLAGNPYLTSVYESVHTAVISYEYRPWVQNNDVPRWLRPDQAEQQIALHEPIVAAIEAGDTEAAVRAVRHHHVAMLGHLHDGRAAAEDS